MSELSLDDQVLLAVLAATDAVFLPDRDPLARPRHAVIGERRAAFQYSGVPWSSERVVPGLDETGRKQVQRVLDRLTLDGQLVTYQPKGAKTLGMRLSDAGDARARALAGLPGLSDALATLGQLDTVVRTSAARAFLGRTWAPETALAGVEWGDHAQRHAFIALEEQLLPALVRHWAESNCSVQGHCWYTLSGAGAKQLGKSVAASDLPPAIEAARREYDHRVQQELETLAVAKPESEREIGQIPMPVCSLPV